APPVEDDRGSSDALRILIVDDHASVRSALRHLFQTRRDFSVVGDASNGFDAIARAHTLRPDVILMDVAMPYMDGVEATARIRTELPDLQIGALSMQAQTDGVHPIQLAGATSYFVKDIDTERLIDCLLALHASRRAR